MKYNIRREFEDEVKYFKGLANQSYNCFLVPLASDLAVLIARVLKASKVILFMQHKDIDHLYSIGLHETDKPTQVGQFSVGSIRMKNSNGLAGKAFTEGKIVVDCPKEGSNHEILIAEEKDLSKLNLTAVKNALAIPVMDKQNGTSQAVLQVYNFDEANYKENLSDGGTLWDLANMLSAIMFSVDNLQGTLATNDMLE